MPCRSQAQAVTGRSTRPANLLEAFEDEIEAELVDAHLLVRTFAEVLSAIFVRLEVAHPRDPIDGDVNASRQVARSRGARCAA